jgi:hypothetical protein
MLFLCLFVYGFGVRDWTQSLSYMRHVVCHWVIPNPREAVFSKCLKCNVSGSVPGNLMKKGALVMQGIFPSLNTSVHTVQYLITSNCVSSLFTHVAFSSYWHPQALAQWNKLVVYQRINSPWSSCLSDLPLLPPLTLWGNFTKHTNGNQLQDIHFSLLCYLGSLSLCLTWNPSYSFVFFFSTLEIMYLDSNT